MNKVLFYSTVTAIMVGLSGCSNIVELSSEGAQIKLLKKEQLGKKCNYLGRVFAYDTNGATQSYQSHEHLYQDELNILKNKAAILGANSLSLTKHKVRYLGKTKDSLVDQHELEGSAYYCNYQ